MTGWSSKITRVQATEIRTILMFVGNALERKATRFPVIPEERQLKRTPNKNLWFELMWEHFERLCITCSSIFYFLIQMSFKNFWHTINAFETEDPKFWARFGPSTLTTVHVSDVCRNMYPLFCVGLLLQLWKSNYISSILKYRNSF